MPTPKEFIEKNRRKFIDKWFEALRIPSVSAEADHKPDMRRMAEWLADRLDGDLGFAAHVIETQTNPLVFGQSPEVPGAPTVLIYGHYDVQPVDPLLYFRIVQDPCPKIVIQFGIREPEIFFVGPAGKTVDRRLFDQDLRQPEHPADSFDLLHGQMRAGAEVSGSVAVTGRISDPVLGEVAGVGDPSVVALCDRIKGCHTDPCRQIDPALLR